MIALPGVIFICGRVDNWTFFVVPVVAASRLPYRHIELQLVVDLVRLILPNVPLDPSRSQHGPPETDWNQQVFLVLGLFLSARVRGVDGRLSVNAPDPLGPGPNEPILRDDVLKLVQALVVLASKVVDVVHETDGQISVNTPRPKIRGMHAGSADSFAELEHFLAFLEEPEERRYGPDVQGEADRAHDVVQDAGQFGEEDADELGSSGRPDVQQLFHRQAVSVLVAHAGGVVQAV